MKDKKLKILIITAHPDDEAICGATIYKLVKDFGAVADLAIMTNGEGGYQYAILAEKMYGLQLTDEAIGRAYLPTIRKKELLSAAQIIGLRNCFFLEQTDNNYSHNVADVLEGLWDIDFCLSQLNKILNKENYDLLITMLPFGETHAHHKAVAILSLKAVQSLPAERRPTILGAHSGLRGEHKSFIEYVQMPHYPITKVNQRAGILTFDKHQTFGHQNRLNYNIIISWLIAEHKSQGTMQMLMNKGRHEYFWFFELNEIHRLEAVKLLFEALHTAPNS